MTCGYCDGPGGTLSGQGHFRSCPRFRACARFRKSKFQIGTEEVCGCGGTRDQHGKGRVRA